MPPKTRRNVSNASKENIALSCKTRTKTTSKVTNLPRKALADKTNSASDDNASILPVKQSVNVASREGIHLPTKQRPRRSRRIPSRYVENNGIQNQSKSNNASAENDSDLKTAAIKTIPIVVLSPLKTPKLGLDTSLMAKRPKRICRLPSKFHDHSISPSKYIPVQPAYASTPKISNKPTKQIELKGLNKAVKAKKTSAKVTPLKTNKKTVNKNNEPFNKTSSANSSADTNNNAKTDRIPHNKTKNKQNTSPKLATRKLANKNFSIRILEDKKKSLKSDASNFDVYEFTYDPNEEPPPQKKKRKKPTKKREPKPKMVHFKDNYNRNLAKALTNLKTTISAKSAGNINKTDNVKVLPEPCVAHPVADTLVTSVQTQPIPSKPCNSEKIQTSVNNYNSVRVEDIALDFEPESYEDNINYSPVYSPCQPATPNVQNNIPGPEKCAPNNPMTPLGKRNDPLVSERSMSKNDPLNLRDELSFFDDQPVASSSMHVSTRDPAASPWRVEFGKLPIKWQVNTYVKPNMTPAFDSSFMNFNDSKKKHVYTNMIPISNEETDLPQIYEDYSSKLKQTSIISFIKDVVDKQEKRKKSKITPVKANSLFEDLNNTSVYKGALTQNDQTTPKKNSHSTVQLKAKITPNHNVTDKSNESDQPENSKENGPENVAESVKNTNKKRKDKNMTYFGFDNSENHDQENVSPVKKLDKRRLRALRPRSRAVLQEINDQKGPTRAVFPVAVKSKAVQNSVAANNLFDQMKSATEPPVFSDNNVVQSMEASNITEVQNIENGDTNDDESVHLFEDIELVHHLRAHRKSYGKAKKVTCRQKSLSDSDVPASDVAEQSESGEDDDLHDLTFKVPAMDPQPIARKKKPKKAKISKKEEREVEAWAAGFNSMCEDIEGFDLVVE